MNEIVKALARDIDALTCENDHTQARFILAVALKNHKWTRVLTALETMISAYGYLPPGGSTIQQEALRALLEQATNEWGAEASKVLHAAF